MNERDRSSPGSAGRETPGRADRSGTSGIGGVGIDPEKSVAASAVDACAFRLQDAKHALCMAVGAYGMRGLFVALKLLERQHDRASRRRTKLVTLRLFIKTLHLHDLSMQFFHRAYCRRVRLLGLEQMLLDLKETGDNLGIYGPADIERISQLLDAADRGCDELEAVFGSFYCGGETDGHTGSPALGETASIAETEGSRNA